MPNLPPREAIAIAKDYVRENYFDQQIEDLLLEEIEFDDANAVWRVTIGFRLIPGQARQNPLESLSIYGGRRLYKLVSVDDATKQPVSMAIREVYAAWRSAPLS